MIKKENSVRGSTPDIVVTKIMLMTLVSTTLRVFVPTLGLFGIGTVIDLNFDTMPYGMIIGTAVGIVIAAVLVYLQLRAVKKEKKGEK